MSKARPRFWLIAAALPLMALALVLLSLALTRARHARTEILLSTLIADYESAPSRRTADRLVKLLAERRASADQGRRVTGRGHVTDRIDAKTGDQDPAGVRSDHLRLDNRGDAISAGTHPRAVDLVTAIVYDQLTHHVAALLCV